MSEKPKFIDNTVKMSHDKVTHDKESKNKESHDGESQENLITRVSRLAEGFSQLNQEALAEELEQLMQQCIDDHEILAALMNCKALVTLQTKLKNTELEKKYAKQLEQLRKQQLELNQEKWNEIKKINQIITQLESKISIDQDIAPSFYSLSPADLQIQENQLTSILQDADKLLESHRVKQDMKVLRSGVVQLQSGKAFPIRDQKESVFDLDIKADDDKLEYSVEFSLDLNTSDEDPIENAFIQDIIPYNFEVLEISMNGEPATPDKKALRQEGLELSYHLKNLNTSKPINFKYIFRPRVSRTILVPTPTELQVIHTHSNMDEYQGAEGSYRTYLQFRNDYEEELDNVLMEDIIPEFYHYEVQEKKQGNFSSKKESSPFLVKWRLFDMAQQYASEHEYQLTEYEVIEAKKREAERILSTPLDQIPDNKLKDWHRRRSAAKKFLSELSVNYKI